MAVSEKEYPFQSDHNYQTALVIDALTGHLAEDLLKNQVNFRVADISFRVAVLVVEHSRLELVAKSPLNTIYDTLLTDVAKDRGFAQTLPPSDWSHDRWRFLRRKQFSQGDARVKNGAELLWSLCSSQAQTAVLRDLAILAK